MLILLIIQIEYQCIRMIRQYLVPDIVCQVSWLVGYELYEEDSFEYIPVIPVYTDEDIFIIALAPLP